MLPHQERVIEEKKELDEKREKLNAFGCTETFAALSAEEQGRLNQQCCVMQNYSYILSDRIKAFTPEAEQVS